MSLILESVVAPPCELLPETGIGLRMLFPPPMPAPDFDLRIILAQLTNHIKGRNSGPMKK